MARTDPTIYMRIPQELKDALDAAAAENKRSLTAEVVARLTASLDPQNDPSALQQKMLEMEGDAAIAVLQASKTKSDLLAAQLLVIQMAKMCPSDLMNKDSSIGQIIQGILDREGEIMQETITNMIDGLLGVKDAMNKRIESGQLKVVPDSEEPTGFSAVIDRIKDLRSSTQELNELVAKSKPRSKKPSQH
ncbi:Arc family DNA-binding protein [Comamonas sp. C11]|uniref:Arc family DNA-binding protein n=1 Tax=Comamonas sp. C11 TaxID=2966554 RepID=UPI0021134D1E|nr:Arc family DNA-binding protein [Comamonas sp. C11]UUC92462.1 Arc family DNA-binding protein [Comamonas sp. C11]UUC92514.1 Arc family DNA-binding protein [Comamonas sp. C11]